MKGFGNSYHSGWVIQKEADPRWEKDDETLDFYIARIYSQDSAIIGIPGCSYDHCWNVGLFPTDEVPDEVIQDMNEFQHKIAPPLKRHGVVPMIWYLLKFPPPPGVTGVQLSVREIYIDQSDIKDDTTLPQQYFPCVSTHKVIGRYITWWLQWTVVCNDTGCKDGDRKRGQPVTEKPKSKAAVAAAKYSSLYAASASARPPTTTSSYSPHDDFTMREDDGDGE
jgi:hypothetical protein